VCVCVFSFFFYFSFLFSLLSKAKLTSAIWNDTLFLSHLNIMDYSLLLGIDQETGTLVAGIIDYMRTYTWDKQVENIIKSSGLVGGGRKVPTVISPEFYKARFRDRMWMYFVLQPSRHLTVGTYEEE
jgi:1-phosphatidylinositol-3-phosphate 5-kinase